MNAEPEKIIRALGLCSGGLDSTLAALVLRGQGIHVEWVAFVTPFFSADKAQAAARATGIPLHVRDITADYMPLLKNPPVGFGKNMNPCMDCHALMFRKAGEMLRELGFNFLFSGEVLGQRPMSQNANALRYVEKHSGFDGLILRPLSAQRLPATDMETRGLVDRKQLLGLSGRSRKPQMALALQYGIRDYPAPAGGCLLTDPGYSKRLKDLLNHCAPDAFPRTHELHLLKYGRHMRLNPTTKIVIGRTQQDNEAMSACSDPLYDTVIKIKKYPGPLVIMPGGGPAPLISLAAAICAGYGKAPENLPATAVVTTGDRVEEIGVLAISPREAARFLIV
jgi:hypothetical protein